MFQRVTIRAPSALWNHIISLDLVYSTQAVDQVVTIDWLDGLINLDILGCPKDI